MPLTPYSPCIACRLAHALRLTSSQTACCPACRYTGDRCAACTRLPAHQTHLYVADSGVAAAEHVQVGAEDVAGRHTGGCSFQHRKPEDELQAAAARHPQKVTQIQIAV